MAKHKTAKRATGPVDVTEFGLRLPAPLPEISSGDAKFDAAIATLLTKCARAANKREPLPVALPARLAKPQAGDATRVIAHLGPAACDLGESAFDYDRGHEAGYNAAWKATHDAVVPRALFVITLAKLALADDAGEGRVREIVADMTEYWCAGRLVEAVLASERAASEATLETCTRVLDLEGDPSALHMTWVAGARAAVALGPARAATLLAPHLATTRAKAIAEALATAESLDAAWRDTCLPLAREGHEIATALLLRLPVDAEILDTLAAYLHREAEQYGFMMTKWAFDHLVEHAGAHDLARFPEGIAGAIEAEQT